MLGGIGGQEEKGTTEDEMARWHHWLDGRESEWTAGVGDGQGGLECCSSWSRKESDMTERLNWTELNYFPKNWNIEMPSIYISWYPENLLCTIIFELNNTIKERNGIVHFLFLFSPPSTVQSATGMADFLLPIDLILSLPWSHWPLSKNISPQFIAS